MLNSEQSTKKLKTLAKWEKELIVLRMLQKQILENLGVVTVNSEKTCRILRSLAKDVKAAKLPFLSKHHKENYVSFAK